LKRTNCQTWREVQPASTANQTRAISLFRFLTCSFIYIISFRSAE